MYLTETDVRSIATYTRIALTETEVQDMARDLNDIIANLQPIRNIDLTGVTPTFHPIAGLSNIMREDLPQPGFSQAEALVNAPAEQEGQFLIPPILGDSGGDR